MANEKNLMDVNELNARLTPEQRKANASKAGKASGQKRRERKQMKEQLEMLLNLPLQNNKLKEQMAKLGIEDNEMNNQMAMTIAIYQEAMKGNTKAFEIIRDTIGEKPIERQEIKEVDTDWFIDE